LNIVRYQPNEIEIETFASLPSYLVMSETYYPGWKAKVDRKRAPVYPANIAFRAVPVPSGHHNVRLLYKPESVRIGAYLAGVGLLLLLVSMIRLRPRRGQIPERVPSADKTHSHDK
jgi:uncharacterized membrane protein YfhO